MIHGKIIIWGSLVLAGAPQFSVKSFLFTNLCKSIGIDCLCLSGS
jgi:hypothetical protein